MGSGSFKNVIYKMCLEIIYLKYKYEHDLALNNQQWISKLATVFEGDQKTPF